MYCIYLRKSRADSEAEARGEGETLARHEAALLDLARKRGIAVTKIYREIVSADTIENRPEMRRLLDEVENGMWDGVLVMDIDRLARGRTVDQGIVAEAFKNSDTFIVTPSKTYDPNNEFDEEFFEFGLFMARREYQMIKRRLQRGKTASAKEGKWLVNAPYGYRKVKLKNEKGHTLEPEPEKAKIISMIFDWYVNGIEWETGEIRRLGIDKIATRLNRMHVPPARLRHWTKATLRDMLINPVYAGKVRWGYRKAQKKILNGKTVVSHPCEHGGDCIIADGRHPAIVPIEVFEKAQEYLKNEPPMPLRYKLEVRNPLAGIIRCAKCGRSIILRVASRGRPSYLVCRTRTCKNISARFDLVEARVLYSLRQWLGEHEIELSEGNKNANADADAYADTQKRLDAELAALRKQLDKAHDLLEQGVYDRETFMARSRTLSERIDRAQTDIKQIQSEIDEAQFRQNAYRTLAPKVRKLLDVYNDLPNAAIKNEMLKSVLEKAVYLKEVHGGYKGNSPEDFTLEIFPKLPKYE
jgi:DNA invertase Pin-like site-specific DNA recombinase